MKSDIMSRLFCTCNMHPSDVASLFLRLHQTISVLYLNINFELLCFLSKAFFVKSVFEYDLKAGTSLDHHHCLPPAFFFCCTYPFCHYDTILNHLSVYSSVGVSFPYPYISWTSQITT